MNNLKNDPLCCPWCNSSNIKESFKGKEVPEGLGLFTVLIFSLWLDYMLIVFIEMLSEKLWGIDLHSVLMAWEKLVFVMILLFPAGFGIVYVGFFTPYKRAQHIRDGVIVHYCRCSACKSTFRLTEHRTPMATSWFMDDEIVLQENEEDQRNE